MGLFDAFNYDPLGYMTGSPEGAPSGLLDQLLNTKRGNSQLMAFGQALAQAGAPRRGPSAGFAGGLSEALGAFGQAGQKFDFEQMQKQMQELQLKKMQSDIAENDAQTAARNNQAMQQAKIQQLLSMNPAMTLGAAQGDIGPTNTNAARIPQNPMDAYNARASMLENAGFVDQGFKMRKDAKELAPQVDKYDWVTGPDGKPQLTALFKDASAPKAIAGLGQIADPNKPFGPGGIPNLPYQQYEINKSRAGAANVNVNTGQKGFDNELKLRSDFRGEPIYKAHQEVQSAYSQITQSLKQASPAGDLAGATKIMKILDPTSVVRESELGMAMAATGVFDRLTDYANKIIKGTKLTPAQRADFQNLADVLYNESAKQFNAKQSEYSGIAKDYGLNANRVTGPAATMSAKELFNAADKIISGNP